MDYQGDPWWSPGKKTVIKIYKTQEDRVGSSDISYLPVKQIFSNWSCRALSWGITSQVLQLFVDTLQSHLDELSRLLLYFVKRFLKIPRLTLTINRYKFLYWKQNHTSIQNHTFWNGKLSDSSAMELHLSFCRNSSQKLVSWQKTPDLMHGPGPGAGNTPQLWLSHHQAALQHTHHRPDKDFVAWQNKITQIILLQ